MGQVWKAEQLQLTVMFCDLVGSTTLSEQLTLWALRDVLRAYQETCALVIQKEQGYIAQYLGDGLLVYFGYPTTFSDDAHRAVRAALGILAAIEQLSRTLMKDRGIPLAVRIGIHTGQVLVAEVGGGHKHERLAIGPTPNIAARLQSLAVENSIVFSQATYRLVQGLFDFQSLGWQRLKGIAKPMEVYQATNSREGLR